jgi:predicted dehydrogenase
MQPENENPRESIDSSRRAFLAKTAALAGVAAVGCQSIRHTEAAIPHSRPRISLGPDATIRMGLIGAGGMGNGHLDAIMSLREKGVENVDIVAIAEVCKPRRDAAVKKCAERQGFGVDSYVDYHELLDRDDIHAVLIASPEHWHAKMAEDAIAAGKDVYLEKPMTLHLEDALRLKRVVESNTCLLQVGTQYMMVPKYIEAQRLIAAGAIGHPTLSQTSYCRNSRDGEWLYEIDETVEPGEMLDWERWLGPSKWHEFDTEIYHRWRRYKDFSTGIIGDLLVHQMTPLMMALDAGWPVRVSASGGHYVDKAMENHDQVFLNVEFEKEHTMVVAGSTCNDTGLEVLVRGHEANLHLGGNNCVLRPQQPFVDDVDEQTIECPGVNSQDELRRNWLGCIRSREPVRSPVAFGARHMVIVDLATRSLWQGGAFEFDPATMKAKLV